MLRIVAVAKGQARQWQIAAREPFHAPLIGPLVVRRDGEVEFVVAARKHEFAEHPMRGGAALRLNCLGDGERTTARRASGRRAIGRALVWIELVMADEASHTLIVDVR